VSSPPSADLTVRVADLFQTRYRATGAREMDEDSEGDDDEDEEDYSDNDYEEYEELVSSGSFASAELV